MCETFPPKREVCLVAPTSIKVGSENRLPNKNLNGNIIASEAKFPMTG
jgi:hypothetical protein